MPKAIVKGKQLDINSVSEEFSQNSDINIFIDRFLAHPNFPVFICDLLFPINKGKYIQLSDSLGDFENEEDPNVKFPNTIWEQIFDDEGVVFQTEGYDGEGRTDGLMESQIQGFKLNIPIGGYDYSGGSAGTYIAGNANWYGYNAYQPLSDEPLSGHQYITEGLHGPIKVGTRTTHRNRLMRIWIRRG